MNDGITLPRADTIHDALSRAQDEVSQLREQIYLLVDRIQPVLQNHIPQPTAGENKRSDDGHSTLFSMLLDLGDQVRDINDVVSDAKRRVQL